MGEGAVGAALDVFAAAIQSNRVVRGDFSAEADSALGEARGVVQDGALNPVDSTRAVQFFTVPLVLEDAAALLVFVGVPVTGSTRQALAIDKTFGFRLGIGTCQLSRNEILADAFSMGPGGDAADG
ncbi:hypothetical protein D3C85_1456020 [compost metagenome]